MRALMVIACEQKQVEKECELETRHSERRSKHAGVDGHCL